MKEELYNKIENYINGQLAGQDLIEFDKLMKSDVEFAEEVRLHRSLQESMADPEKRKLRDSLDLMREEFKDAKAEEDKVVTIGNSRQQRIWWMAAASVVLLGLTWWFMLRKPDIPNEMVKDPEIEETQEAIDNKIDEPDINTTIPSPENNGDIVKEDPPKSSVPDDEPKTNIDPVLGDPTPPSPSIDYFAANSDIASVISNIKEQRTHKFNLQIPATNERITTTNGTVALYFKGELISFDYPENEKFSLTIFDNQSDSYQNNKPVYQTDMDFVKVEGPIGFGGEEDFTFIVDQPVKMKEGLYYYLIRLSEETLIGGTFIVDNQ